MTINSYLIKLYKINVIKFDSNSRHTIYNSIIFKIYFKVKILIIKFKNPKLNQGGFILILDFICFYFLKVKLLFNYC